MLGSIIGAGLSAVGGIVGGISARKSMRKVEKSINERKRKNEDWYNRRYNEDPTQRASAQRMITQVNESIKKRNRQVAGTQAVMGGTDESVAAAREANSLAMADTMSQIAVQGDARKDAIEQQYMGQDDALAQQQEQLYMQKAQNTAGAIQGVTGAAAGIASAF